ncbi:hypothetical protein Slala03_05550 [Streptomyces lavendulae subsp. lavendulae]|nr:hypothetical protein Slala03_05550 [Streptomyces lavendulae subsp. lavendulae]
MPYLPEDPHDSRLPVQRCSLADTLTDTPTASNHARSDGRSLPMGYPGGTGTTPDRPPLARTLAKDSTTSGW